MRETTKDVDARRAAAPKVRELAQALTGLLADGPWSPDARELDHYAGIVRADGAEVGLSFSYPYRRIEIGGRFPVGYAPYGECFGITVAVDATPERIAREINRRLLPGYLPAYTERAGVKSEHEAQRTAALALVAGLRAKFGDTRKHDDTRDRFNVYVHNTREAVSIDVEVSTTGRARFTVDLSNAEDARELAGTLARRFGSLVTGGGK